MNGNDTARTVRDPLDFYPTPTNVTEVFRGWLASHSDAPSEASTFLDPAAGDGHLIRAMRGVWGASRWTAIEIDPVRANACLAVADKVIIGDALEVDWPAGHVVMNPPFSRLDEFWQVASQHREDHGMWVAALTPVAWWSAEKRRRYVRPDYMIALGWRPSFRSQTGAGHKGSQDFCWSVLAPEPQTQTIWTREEKPANNRQ